MRSVTWCRSSSAGRGSRRGPGVPAGPGRRDDSQLEATPPLGHAARPLRILFLENDDSFSWNVVEALPFARREVTLLHVRERGVEDADLAGYHGLVIGPGPMDPQRAGLVEIVRAAADRGLPTLGICLGHQAIGMAFGARLIRTPPVHGKTTELQFSPSRWLPLPQGPWTVMRYHSLAVDEVKAPLRTIALSPEGVVMALEHQTLPILGLQFHPDSYASQRGPELLESFFRAAGVLRDGP